MKKMWVVFIIVWLLFGGIMLTLGYLDTIYRLERAVGYLSRAQAAGFAEDMSLYLRHALEYLPNRGNPVWIFPTSRTNFTLIYEDLITLERRLEIIAQIPRNSSAYAQSLNDIRGKITVLIGQIGEAMPYTLITPLNTALALIWLITPYATYRITNHLRNKKTLDRESESSTMDKRAGGGI